MGFNKSNRLLRLPDQPVGQKLIRPAREGAAQAAETHRDRDWRFIWIGGSLLQYIRRAGANVVLAVRRTERLEEVKQLRCHAT